MTATVFLDVPIAGDVEEIDSPGGPYTELVTELS